MDNALGIASQMKSFYRAASLWRRPCHAARIRASKALFYAYASDGKAAFYPFTQTRYSLEIDRGEVDGFNYLAGRGVSVSQGLAFHGGPPGRKIGRR